MKNLSVWFFSHGLKVILILIAASLVNRFLATFIKKFVKKQIKDKTSEEKRRKRAETLISVFYGTTEFIIWIVAILMILPEFGINIAPILAGLGVAGLAVGMAAREIISDFISGLFIILESQYSVGDKVKIAGIEGEVKMITLRRTIIKEGTGILHSIPNSQIKLVSKKLK
ncbi:MAG: mechanosensitive ion channel [Patescibacteria group bacterium]|nr:mechanosensitive ion channel [Patescibacteria group bacterium]